MACVSLLLKRTAIPFSNNSVTHKYVIYLFNTFDSALIVKFVCELRRIYQQLLNIKCHMYDNDYLSQRYGPIKDCRSHFLFIIYSLYFTIIHHSEVESLTFPAFVKDRTMKRNNEYEN